MNIVGEPDIWRIKLKSGNDVVLRAGSYHEADRYYIFSDLIDASKEEQESLHVTGTFPTRPERVVATVAAFLMDDVEDIQSGEDWQEIPKTQ